MLKKLSVINNMGSLEKGYLQPRNRLRVDHRVDVFQEKSVFLEQSSTTSMQKQWTDPIFSPNFSRHLDTHGRSRLLAS